MTSTAGELFVELHASAFEDLIRELYEARTVSDGPETAERDFAEFREQLSAEHVLAVAVTRRAGAAVGWARIVDPGMPERHLILLPEVPVEETEIHRMLLSTAREMVTASGHPAMRFIVQGRDLEQVAVELGACPHEELSKVWRAIRPGQQPGPPAEVIVELVSPPTVTTLARYAQLYTDAEVSRCDESGCTTGWDVSTVNNPLADRDEFLHTDFSLGLLDSTRLAAEASVGIVDGRATLLIVHAQATVAQLTALLGSVLDRAFRVYPSDTVLEISTDPKDQSVNDAVQASGFMLVARVVEYELTVTER